MTTNAKARAGLGTYSKLCGRRYPWIVWFSKNTFTIRPGEYNGRPDTMAQQIRARAKTFGKSVHIAISSDGTLVVKVG